MALCLLFHSSLVLFFVVFHFLICNARELKLGALPTISGGEKNGLLLIMNQTSLAAHAYFLYFTLNIESP